MSVLSCTISGVTYSVKNDQTISLEDTLEVRGILTITIVDLAGTAVFTRGQPIIIADSVSGNLYVGRIGADQQNKYGPGSTAVDHVITAYDLQYYFDKRANTTNYFGWYAGDIMTDFVEGTLVDEGVTIAAGIRHDTTNSDFNIGILSGVVGTTNDTGDGDLELAPAGSDVSISETTTADFSTGTLTNVVAANNQLSPSTQMALKFLVTTPISTQTTFAFVYAKFWTGSMVVGVSDTLNFDVWIADSSPEKIGGIVPLFSDLTIPGGIYDQNGLLNDGNADLSAYAVNQWYTRNESLAAYSGKTIIAMLAQVQGQSVGTYTWYIRNAYLGSQTGNKFFSTTSTVPQLNPPTIYQSAIYVPATFRATVVTTFDPNNSYRISTSHSIDAVKLLKGSFIGWSGSINTALSISYNSGASWIPCTNGAALPGMPVGSNVAGLSLQLKESFSVGSDPTIIPEIADVSVSLLSAPNATKSDIVTSFLTQTNWNTGTHSSTQADVSGKLMLAPYSRDWNNNLITSQTAHFPSGTTEAATGGAYTITCPPNSLTTPGTDGFGTSQLDFLGNMLDFTLELDVKSSHNNEETGITYRQIQWQTINNTFGYLVSFNPGSPGFLQIGYGSNSTSDSYTRVAYSFPTASTGTFYHIKIVVNGNHHQVYWNNATTPDIDIVDKTYTQAGGIGFRGYNQNGSTGSHTSTWDNLVLAQTPSGMWTSPSTSISSLGTCGDSVISWNESGTGNPAYAYAFVQTSINGGSTYQQCVSGAQIPGLTPGINLSGKSVLIQALLGTQSNTVPEVSGLVWRVLGAYPGSSGTRSTIPIANDTMVRANQAGAGTSFDGQSITKVGTGTDAIASNKLTITNTTGDVFEVYGSRTGTDMDGTHDFSLSASTMTEGLALRYVDSNNYYLLKASTTTLTLLKKRAGVSTTLATFSKALSTATNYYMRFRVIGTSISSPISLYGRVWLAGTLESTTWDITGSD